MRDILAALLITLAVTLAALGLWLGFAGPVLSGAQGFAAVLFVAAGILAFAAFNVRPEREAN
jgi:uncharacterized membrane protein